MKRAQTLFQCLCLVLFPFAGFGAGYRYPDGTVSPYPPRFFGIGFYDPFESSIATGVAAEGPTIKAVSVTVSHPGSDGRQAAFYNPTLNQIVALPDEDSFDASRANGLSASGTIKVGQSLLPETDAREAACFWDQENKFYILPFPPKTQTGPVKERAAAFAISADRFYVAGFSGYYELRFNLPVGLSEYATRWQTTNGAPTTFENLSGYDQCRASGISANGQILCGSCVSHDGGSTHAFRLVVGAGMEDLGVLPGFGSSVANGITDDGNMIVGTCSFPVDGSGLTGTKAFLWERNGGTSEFDPAPSGQSIPVSGALAISAGGFDIVALATQRKACLGVLPLTPRTG